MSVVSGILNSQAQRSAANTQADAYNNATAETAREFGITQAQQEPWRAAGAAALPQQQAMLGNYPSQMPDMSTGAYQQSDYDKWVMQQGVNALSASGAASGMYGSGNLGGALTQYGQNTAGGQYQQWRTNTMNDYNTQIQNYINQYNQLAGISGTGQVSAQNMAAQGTNYANTMALLGIGGAQAQGQGAIGQAGAWTNAISGGINQTIGGIGAYNQYQYNQQLANALAQNQGGAAGYNANFNYDQSYAQYNANPYARYAE